MRQQEVKRDSYTLFIMGLFGITTTPYSTHVADQAHAADKNTIAGLPVLPAQIAQITDPADPNFGKFPFMLDFDGLI